MADEDKKPKKRKKKRVARKTRTIVKREVIHGQISKIVRTERIIEPAESKSTKIGHTLPDVPGLKADDVEPLNHVQDVFFNSCRASMANGIMWVKEPCVKIIAKTKMIFNAPAMRLFGLDGCVLGMSMTVNKAELRFHSVKLAADNRTVLHREGLYRIRDGRTRSRKCDTPMGIIETSRTFPVLIHSPGLIGYIFPLRQHPDDRNVLVVKTSQGYHPDTDHVHKLTLRTQRGLNALFSVAGKG